VCRNVPSCVELFRIVANYIEAVEYHYYNKILNITDLSVHTIYMVGMVMYMYMHILHWNVTFEMLQMHRC
jgi:hypothetical protein